MASAQSPLAGSSARLSVARTRATAAGAVFSAVLYLGYVGPWLLP